MDGGLLHLLIQIIIVGLVCFLLWWLIGFCGLPAPFDKVARVIVAIIAVIFLLNIVMGLGGAAGGGHITSFRW